MLFSNNTNTKKHEDESFTAGTMKKKTTTELIEVIPLQNYKVKLGREEFILHLHTCCVIDGALLRRTVVRQNCTNMTIMA